MIDKKKLFGIEYAITDYDQASDYIIKAAKEHQSIAVSALADHGLISSVLDKELFKKTESNLLPELSFVLANLRFPQFLTFLAPKILR